MKIAQFDRQLMSKRAIASSSASGDSDAIDSNNESAGVSEADPWEADEWTTFA